MHDDAVTPRRVVGIARTYQEASALKEILRQLGVPASEVELRVRGLKLVSPPTRLVVATVFGMALLGVSPLLGLAGYALRTIPWAAGTVIALPALALFVASLYFVRRNSARSAGGYALPKRVDVVVSQPYAQEALRVLTAGMHTPQQA